MSETFPEYEDRKDIEWARFADKLDYEYEGMWSELADAVENLESPTFEVLSSIWKDEAIPPAFRDRAMLSLAGERGKFGIKTVRDAVWVIFGKSILVELNEKLGFEYEDKLNTWLDESLDYQEETGTKLISDYAYSEWA